MTATKITTAHLERIAVVYVRQSSIAQVREHTESTARQYGLTREAARLGWSAERISVIDADLGVSGRMASARSGFKELVGRVCVGEVGAILGLEVSRLARSSADLQRLLELCALTDTLIIDSDGIYDLVLRPKRSASFVTEHAASIGGGETPIDAVMRTISVGVPGARATAQFVQRRDAIATEALA